MKSLRLSILAIIAITLLAGNADAIKVKYITGENVYLDAGTGDSLSVGDRLTISKGDKVTAELEVVFAAEHSASCRVVSQESPIEIGDVAGLVPKETTPEPIPGLGAKSGTAARADFTRYSPSQSQIEISTPRWQRLAPALPLG